MNDTNDTNGDHVDADQPRSFELELADGDDVSEIELEQGQLNDINYGF